MTGIGKGCHTHELVSLVCMYLYRRCLMSILSTFYSPEVVTEPKHKLSESGNYYIPPKGSYNYILLYTNVLYTNVLYTNVLYTNVLLL